MGGFLSRIEVTAVRNLEHVSLHPAPRINVLYGPNGSGKSSFLEAIHLLGVGRSFRSPHVRQVISAGKKGLVVFGEYSSPEGGSTSLGIAKETEGTTIQINGQRVATLSELARRLPLQLITPDSCRLIEGSPKYRRRYLNWGMFHVEQSFFPLWKRYQHILNQRNAALRGKFPDDQIRTWDKEMSRLAIRITELRHRYLERLLPLVQRAMANLLRQGGERELTLRFSPGWNEEKGYDEQLATALCKDRERGYTRYGPHRCDLHVLLDGTPARERVSRGEQKIMSMAMYLAQVELMVQIERQMCVVLVDDLPSELDERSRSGLFRYLQELGCQAFVTAVDRDLLGDRLAPEIDGMFHVEHGIIEKVV